MTQVPNLDLALNHLTFDERVTHCPHVGVVDFYYRPYREVVSVSYPEREAVRHVVCQACFDMVTGVLTWKR